MLSVPFSRWIPAAFQHGEDPTRDAFCAQVDSVVETARDETLGIGRLKDPARAHPAVLAELGQMLEAGIRESDPEATRRRKVATAVRSHKNRSTWRYSVKPTVDAIVGGDSTIESYAGQDDFILCGDGTEPDAYLWGALGGADPDGEYGVRLVGAGNLESEEFGLFVEPIKGTVAINVGSDSLTEAEVEEVKASLRDHVPAYFKVYLGYLSGDRFVPYPNGLM